jgi:acyl transferase domain-containing protein/NAD(P)H-dependent flavin oxidoreductase YrpB (nitropropane dioxygenase family)
MWTVMIFSDSRAAGTATEDSCHLLPGPDGGAPGDLVIGLSPFGLPDARLVAEVVAAGARGVLDLAGPRRAALAELEAALAWAAGPIGVRVGHGCDLGPDDVPLSAGGVDTLVLGADLTGARAAAWRRGAGAVRVLAEVTSVEEARAAVRAGAAGLVAVGCEAAGRVGELSSFVLLQKLLSSGLTLPVWVRGGIGTRTAAAVVVGGAAGVVLDTQLALLAEASGAERLAAAGRHLDAETHIVAGYRVQVPSAARAGGTDLDAMTGDDVLARMRAEVGEAFIPMGQDCLLASSFADTFTTVARAVGAVAGSVAAALTDPGPAAGTPDPDRPGTPDRPGASAWAARGVLGGDSTLCAALGLRRGVVQGPMTRVSDTPEFALAVADDGALPCLALALADGPAATRLLTETRALLGGRPWGVGILGFAPEEVRSAQLDAVRAARPAAVVIAGGRPAQAAELEDAGIPAFLHVPSPVLLRQFLDAGARRFVFEGMECGGHVGPRASLPLWEAQLAVLDSFLDGLDGAGGDADGLQILLAGGIHDARSAAMAAVAVAPLAARGVAAGLLVGTAYLFTEEAVLTGAVLPGFQQRVVDAEATALLQTAPGHLTRCVPSPFVDHFERLRDELRGQGRTGPDLWAALESLTIGRLRLASKGVTRQGGELVEVDGARQAAEGLFMAGQVAALRDAATTVPALHDSVTDGAVRFLDAARLDAAGDDLAGGATAGGATAGGRRARRVTVTEPDRRPAPRPVDVAIVGMACVLPQAADLPTYWANVIAGVNAIEPVPAHRWDPDLYYRDDLDGKPNGRYTPSKWGGFIPRIPFDPLRYGIPPAMLPNVEPVQFLSLEVARRALEDARLAPGTFDPSRTAVVFGTETNSEFLSAITLRGALPAYYGEVPRELDEILPAITADTFPGILGNIIASRIANRLDFGGPAYVVDAACGSSLAALDLACKELVLGTADTVVCGGADLHNGSMDYLLFSSVGALSPSGHARTFDASADGTTLSEGVACVVLKRLADARRHGDRIYAVVKAVAGSSDGRSLGLTAPRAQGQYLALRRAYERSGVSPTQVGLVEAHGTGTVVGDQAELTSLTRVYSEAGAAPGTTQLGSVKSQIGHTKTAAGLAGLIKVALSIYHGVRPGTLHVTDPNPAWDPGSSPFSFASNARPWAVAPSRRVGAVSAFGFGGANFHAVVTGHCDGAPHRHALDAWPAELFLVRGADRAAALAVLGRLEGLLEANDEARRPWRPRDLARTAAGWADESRAPVQMALVARGLDDLADLVRAARSGAPTPRRGLFLAPSDGAAPGRLAVLFPGQGSQRPGMASDLFVAFPELQEYLRAGSRWADLIHPPSAFTPPEEAAARAALTDTRAAQPALGIVGLATYHLLAGLGLRADMTGGHSFGELTALAAAGAFDTATLLRLASRRAQAILDAARDTGGGTGTMAAVRAPAAVVERVLAAEHLTGDVVVANHNAPDQVVVSGTEDGVAQALIALGSAGHKAVGLQVACAFHSPLIASAVDRFATALDEEEICLPRVPVYANRRAAPHADDAQSVRIELAAQVGAPVRFVEQVEAMYAAGARMFVEAAPGQVLTALVHSVLGDRPHTAVAVDRGTGGIEGLLDALAELAVAGAVPRAGWLCRGRDAVDLTGAVPAPPPAWSIDGRSVLTADGHPLPGGLVPARLVRRAEPERDHAAARGVPDAGAAPAATASADDRRELVTEFLRTSRDILTQQRDVLLAYLGAAGAAAAGGHVPPTAAPPLGNGVAPGDEAPAERSGPRAPAADGPPAGADVGAVVTEVLCRSTGYPPDMVEPDLDLETQLSVDSIKRTEIAGLLIQRLGSPPALAGAVDELTRLRTVEAITAWLTDRLHAPAGAGSAGSQATARPGSPPSALRPSAPRSGRAPRRYVTTYLPHQLPAAASMEGRHVLITGEVAPADITSRLTGLVRRLGAEVTVLGAEHDPRTVPDTLDTVVYLSRWNPGDGGPDLPCHYNMIRSVLSREPRLLVGVAPLAPPAPAPADPAPPAATTDDGSRRHVIEPAAGLRGLFRCIALEHPGLTTRMVELDPDAVDPAATVAAELAAPATGDGTVVVRHTAAGRAAARTVPAPLRPAAAAGAGPAADGVAEAAAAGLDRDAVVLLVGGARGITAGFTTLLARSAGCRLELVGRTEPPPPREDGRTRGATDEQQVRRAVIATGVRTPREVARSVRGVLAAREIRATLADVRAAGGAARYHQADVLDGPALAGVIERVIAEHGRLDGVVYAAGVIEDRLLLDKDEASFRRVFDTKVSGARTLLAALDDLAVTPRFVTLFGSIAGVVGNRGQGDYAAANDALETLGSAWGRHRGVRTLTVHWGPWAPSASHRGMVGPNLVEDFARRGIELIDQEEGHLALLSELAWGDPAQPAVVYTASEWSAPAKGAAA